MTIANLSGTEMLKAFLNVKTFDDHLLRGSFVV